MAGNKVSDAKALDEYTVFLRECLYAIQDVAALGVLEYQGNIKAMVEKLPYQMPDRWRCIVENRNSSRRYVRFSDLVQFITSEARKASNSIFMFPPEGGNILFLERCPSVCLSVCLCSDSCEW